MRTRFLFLVCSLIVPSAFAGDYTTATLAPNAQKFNFSGGESQSAVVPPGKNSQCPAGRVLVSDDNRRPTLTEGEAPAFEAGIGGIRTEDVVHWRNLTSTTIPNRGVSKFIPPPNAVIKSGTKTLTRPRILKSAWADNRLISLPNGDLLYQRLMATGEPMTPEPSWAPQTFRGFFGPGARSTNTIWRSTDCGLTFKYVGQIDSFSIGDKDCANPQPIGDPSKAHAGTLDMGGTDNPNLIVDRKDGTVYALVPCVGNHVQSNPLALGGDINKTYVLSWKPPKPGDVTGGVGTPVDPTAGDAPLFKTRGFYAPARWGAPAVPLSPESMAVASGSGVAIGTIGPDNTFTFPEEMDEPKDIQSSRGKLSDALAKRVSAHILGSTILAHMPGAPGQLLLAFPDKIGTANGYRVFAYDPKKPLEVRFTQLDNITTKESDVIHLTAVDPGDNGPVLLYWTELIGAPAFQGKVHGRVIIDATNRHDVNDITPAPFALTEPRDPPESEDRAKPNLPQPYFYGDYRTAEVFKVKAKAPPDMVVYRYFPMWVQPWTENKTKSGHEPGGSVHYREVTVTVTSGQFFHDVVLSNKPFEQVFGECCDFLPLLRKVEQEQGLTNFSHAGKTAEQAARLDMVEALLQADPNLRDARLRIGLRSSPRRRSHPAIPVPARLSAKERESFEQHQRQEGF